VEGVEGIRRGQEMKAGSCMIVAADITVGIWLVACSAIDIHNGRGLLSLLAAFGAFCLFTAATLRTFGENEDEDEGK
jgi:hypothetical protein